MGQILKTDWLCEMKMVNIDYLIMPIFIGISIEI